MKAEKEGRESWIRPNITGLKQKRRNRTGKKPEHHCTNCGCDRYSPCTCMIKFRKEIANES